MPYAVAKSAGVPSTRSSSTCRRRLLGTGAAYRWRGRASRGCFGSVRNRVFRDPEPYTPREGGIRMLRTCVAVAIVALGATAVSTAAAPTSAFPLARRQSLAAGEHGDGCSSIVAVNRNGSGLVLRGFPGLGETRVRELNGAVQAWDRVNATLGAVPASRRRDRHGLRRQPRRRRAVAEREGPGDQPDSSGRRRDGQAPPRLHRAAPQPAEGCRATPASRSSPSLRVSAWCVWSRRRSPARANVCSSRRERRRGAGSAGAPSVTRDRGGLTQPAGRERDRGCRCGRGLLLVAGRDRDVVDVPAVDRRHNRPSRSRT